MSELLGFIAQCAVCPQRAVVATQPTSGWVCPRCAGVVDEGAGFGDVDVSQAEPITAAVSVPAFDAFAQALYAAPYDRATVAMVGDQKFILQTWTVSDARCEHETSTFETRWVSADPGCGHRSCQRQAAGFCLGVTGAQFDLAEDARLARERAGLDPDWPASEVQG